MTDWLDDLEQEKKRDDDEKERRIQQLIAESQAQQEAEKNNYEWQKSQVDKVYLDVFNYMQRAAAASTRELSISENYNGRFVISNGPHYYLTDYTNNPRDREAHRYMNFELRNDEYFVRATYPTHRQGRDSKGGLIPRYIAFNFSIQVRSISSEHISSWVKWVLTGEDPISDFTDLRHPNEDIPGIDTNLLPIVVGLSFVLIVIIIVVNSRSCG